VASGKITSQQEATSLTNASARIDQLINGTFPKDGGRPDGRGPGFFGNSSLTQTVAQTLGMTAADVQTALQGGKTLAQLATEHGKTTADVENALLAAYKTRLDQLMTTNFQQLRQQRQNGKTPTPTSGNAAATPTPTSG